MQKIYQRINWENEPSKKTAVSEDNLNKMDYALDQIDNRVVQLAGYQDRVAQSEANAKKHADDSKTYSENSKTSEINAKQSELKAKQYMEQAFSGTPEGYSALVEQVGLLDIATSTGNTLYNSKKGGYRLNELVGNTVQNGEPSQSTPIAIENTFDCVEMESGSFDTNNGGSVVNANAIRNKHSIPCKTGDVVKIVLEKPCGINGLFYNNNTHVSSAGDYTSVTERTFTIPSGVTKFNFRIVNATLETVGKISLTVNGKHVVQIVEHGKNLFGGLNFAKALVVSGANATIDGKYVKLQANDNSQRFKYANFKENTQYTFFIKGGNTLANSNSSNLCIEYTDGTISSLDFATDGTMNCKVSASDKSVKCLKGTYYTGRADILYNDFGIFEGVLTLDDFEPYTEKVATIFLDEQLRDTDRLVRKDGVICENHRRATVDLGTLSWTLTDDKYWRANAISNMLGRGNTVNANVIAEKYIVTIANYIANASSIGRIAVANGSATDVKKALFIYCNNGSTTEKPSGFMEYELVNETYTPLDTASQLALNDMETFDGVTYIEVDSKVKPSGISGEYGTSQVGAYTLKSLLNSESNAVKIEDAITTMLLIGA